LPGLRIAEIMKGIFKKENNITQQNIKDTLLTSAKIYFNMNS
jgi:hypothetical protein